MFYIDPIASACMSLFDTLLSVICNCLNKYGLSDLILLGDFIVDFLNPHSTQFSKLSVIMVSSLFLSRIVNEPTCPSGNGLASLLLDLVFVAI